MKIPAPQQICRRVGACSARNIQESARRVTVYHILCEYAVREYHHSKRKIHRCLQDEIDALASSRSSGDTGGSHEGVLTSLLNEMDGVQELLGVTVVAATNRPDVIVRIL